MNFQAVGDLAQNLLIRKQGSGLRNEVAKLTADLTSGERSDLAKSLRGNFVPLGALEHDLKVYSAYETIQRETATLFTVAQDTLESIRSTVQGTGPKILVALTGANSIALDAALDDAHTQLRTVMERANLTHSNRAVFSGDAYSESPLESPETLLSELRLATAAATNTAQFQTAVDDFFADGGAFDTLIYNGSNTLAGSVQIDNYNSVELSIKANDSGFKQMFKGLSTLSLASSSDIPLDIQSIRSIISDASETLISSEDDIITMQSIVGNEQARIEYASNRLNIESSSFSIARNEMVASDPYETATKLEEAQIQLQSLYILTARTSRLSLSEFLR